MAANENIWATLQKLSAGFPDNGEEVQTALRDYYKSIGYRSTEMQISAEHFPYDIDSSQHIRLLAMAVYGDIQGCSGEEGIYRGASLSKKVLLLSKFWEEVGKENKIPDITQIFLSALTGESNSALIEMKKSFEGGVDSNADDKFKKFCRAMKNLFNKILFLSDADSDQIIVELIPLFYADRKPADYGAAIKESLVEVNSKNSDNLHISETIINNIRNKIDAKIEAIDATIKVSEENLAFRKALVALKSDIVEITYYASAQPGLYGLFKKYQKLLESQKDFYQDLKKSFEEYDRFTRVAGAKTFSLERFKNLTLFSIEKEKAMDTLEKNEELIVQRIRKIQFLILETSDAIVGGSSEEEKKDALWVIATEVGELDTAIQKAYQDCRNIKATIQEVEEDWLNIVKKLTDMIGTLEKEMNKASSVSDRWLPMFPPRQESNVLRQEVYKTIHIEARALLAVVERVHSSISVAAGEQSQIGLSSGKR